MRVLYCVGDTPHQWNCAEWRCSRPARALNSSPGNSAHMVRCPAWAVGEFDGSMPDYDTIIIQRDIWGAGMSKTIEWLSAGKRVLLDLDDAYPLMPNNLTSYKFWFKHEATGVDDKPYTLPFDPLFHLRNGIKLVDGVLSPSQVICQDWAHLTRAYYAPNYPEVEPYLANAKSAPVGKELVVGWAGGGSHLLSFQQTNVIPALTRLSEKRNVVIAILGDLEIFRLLPLPHKRKIWIPWTFDMAEYYRNLARLDIGIAPLFGQYDKRRSWIKGIEYGLMGIPWLGTDYQSQYQPYSYFPAHLVVNQARLWEERLTDIVDHYDQYKAQALIEQQQLKAFDINNQVDTLVEIYAGCINEVKDD